MSDGSRHRTDDKLRRTAEQAREIADDAGAEAVRGTPPVVEPAADS